MYHLYYTIKIIKTIKSFKLDVIFLKLDLSIIFFLPRRPIDLIILVFYFKV